MTVENRRIHIRKDRYKFSAAHMTVFEDGTKEALHGHNYTVELTVDLVDPGTNGSLVTFSDLKAPLLKICEKWDEHFLLAARSPFLKVQVSKGSVDFLLCGKRYVLPADEVVSLDVDNITVENLASEFCRQYVNAVMRRSSLIKNVLSFTIRVDESPGQGASATWRNPKI